MSATVGAPQGKAWWGSGGILRREVAPQVGWMVIVLVVGFGVLWPIIQLQWRAFAEGGSAFTRMGELPRIGDTVRTTVILAFMSSVFAVILGTALAWCASLLPRKVQKAGELAPLLPLIVPAVAAVSGWIFLLSPKVGYLNMMLRQTPIFSGLEEGPFDIYTVKWIVLITGLLLSSFVYVFVHTGLKNMGQELEAAAAACGASPVRRLFTITLPLLRPSIVFAAGVVFLLGMGQFTVPLLLGRTSGIDVLTTEMFNLTLRYPIDYGLGAALGFPILVAGIIVVMIQKFLLGEQRRYVVVSARSKYDIRETRWWAAAVIFIYLLITTVLPLMALTYVSLSPFWSGSLTMTELTLRHWKSVLDNPVLVNAVWTSIKTSVIAIAILIPLGFAMAFALLQSTRILRPIRMAIDFLATLPMAMPASLMGFGLLFAYTRPPIQIYGTATVLVVTYITLMVGHSTRLQFTTLVATGQEFLEASKACGAGPIRSLFQVLLPMCRKGIGAMAALTFVLLFHEFSASLMVRSARTQVIGSVMYDVWTGGVYPEVAVLALVMVVVTVIGVLTAVWIGGTDSLKKM
ncbi:ABC transporter permease [Trinickia mobilis]|uniref:ABC transporter permease n=1 Tax=Trinickia mobilis TaxID=2816356 RepID=UPI001A8D4A6E|nr:ABC transporter permease subunit [Trinickia mobilis]